VLRKSGGGLEPKAQTPTHKNKNRALKINSKLHRKKSSHAQGDHMITKDLGHRPRAPKIMSRQQR
jgi:hypothetical protein